MPEVAERGVREDVELRQLDHIVTTNACPGDAGTTPLNRLGFHQGRFDSVHVRLTQGIELLWQCTELA